MKRLLSILIVLVLASGMGFAAGRPEEGTVRVAAQNFNEPIVLGHIARILLDETTDLDATINTEFTGSSVLHQAMTQNEIDVYPTWTGTQLTGILRYEGPNLSSEETFRRVREGFEEEFGFTWSEPLGFNNTYVWAVRRADAEEYGLTTASDLESVAGDWVAAGDDNFDIRPDAYPGWSDHYGVEFDRLVTMQYALMYTAIDQGEVDAIAAFSTDPRIQTLDLVMLEDDLEWFPDYSGSFVVRMELIERHPEVLETLNVLGGILDDATMAELNGRFDEGDEPEDIARDFLVSAGLID
ncbi:MAG: glycine/betaine ABC transporter substrate-binding protein [Spirochaetaceae bacterium]|nr:MAG: glycine/betaine ABC transporter substrate-binding protein [Spirochaetaceae bacterium]